MDGGATDAEDDDVTVVDPEEDDDSCEFIFEEIDVDEQFDWAKHLVLEEDLESDDDEDWVIDTYASGWHSIEEDDRSIYSSQDSLTRASGLRPPCGRPKAR